MGTVRRVLVGVAAVGAVVALSAAPALAQPSNAEAFTVDCGNGPQTVYGGNGNPVFLNGHPIIGVDISGTWTATLTNATTDEQIFSGSQSFQKTYGNGMANGTANVTTMTCSFEQSYGPVTYTLTKQDAKRYGLDPSLAGTLVTESGGGSGTALVMVPGGSS